MSQQEPEAAPTAADSPMPVKRRKIPWMKVSIVVNVIVLLVVVVGLAGAQVVHLSDTDPTFCATCHVMQSHVDSYLTSGNLDNAHQQAGVQCKDCHDYPLSSEIEAGVMFLTNSYEVDDTGELPQRNFGDEICTQCHISLSHVAESTDFLYRNPHGTEMGTFPCATCHVSHGEQIDYCSQCHDNGGQRMIGDDTPRSEQIGVPAPPAAGPYGY